MNARSLLNQAIASLDELKIHLLAEMAVALTRAVSIHSPASPSDIASTRFAADFANRLLLHHATNEERLNKKTFEYLFVASCKAAGKTATRVTLSDHPHADVSVDGVMYSLKTEASAGISEDLITISKLMEARWIRDCRTAGDFVRGLKDKVIPHLESYERIVMLRSFVLKGPQVRYDLIEIPQSVLLGVKGLKASDFSPKTANNSTRASVVVDGEESFILRVDGSVEKITVSSLRLDHCRLHASWQLALNH